MDREARDHRQLAVLVPRHCRHHMHLAGLELIDPRVGVRQELEEQARNLRRAAPVGGHALEQDVLAGLPLDDAIRTGAEERAIVVAGAIDIAPLEQVLGQTTADELQRVGCVDLAVVHDRGQRIGRLHRRDPIEAVRALRVVARVVDRVHGELDIGRGERPAIVPGDVGPQLPGDVHPTIGPQRDTAVLERGYFGREQGLDPHLFVGDRQSLDDGRLDVLEDMRAEAVERVRLAIVADDEEVVGRAGRRATPRARRRRQRRQDDGRRGSDRTEADAHAGSIVISRAMSGTGIAPCERTRS